MKTRLIEKYWDCKYCDSKRIGGSYRKCPNCGKIRDEDTIFYGRHKYVPEQEAVTINRNPDWLCSYCESLNSDDDKVCRSCGSARTAENLDYFQNRRKQEEKQREKEREVQGEQEVTEYFKDIVANARQKYHVNFKYFLAVVFSIFALIGLGILFMPKDKEITIAEISWERLIEIERFQTVNESDWNLPVGARLHYTQEEISHYEQVIDHYETRTREVAKQRISGYEEYVVGTRDLGNGYEEEIIDSRPVYETYYDTETYQEPIYRNEPVYRTRYYYEIDKWLYERTERANNHDKSPHWPELNLSSDERSGSKYEYYYIEGYDNKGKNYSYTMSQDEWKTLNIGQTVKLKVSILGYATLRD